MSSEVVHDDPYGSYLAELEKLDRCRVIPESSRNEIVGLVVLIPVLIATLVSKYVAPWWACIPIGILGLVVMRRYYKYENRLMCQYHQLGMTFLPKLMPEAYAAFGTYLIVREKTRVVLTVNGATYACGLRALSKSKGAEGWSVEIPKTRLEGRFEVVHPWAERVLEAHNSGSS